MPHLSGHGSVKKLPLGQLPLLSRKLLPASITALAVASATGANIAWAQDKPQLEEVLVTATKREQSVQEIPLSVAAVTGDKLNETDTKNLADLTTLVPNIHFTQTGISTQMRIRGIGSDNSQGFEQSVGVYTDGIFRGRAQLFRAPMFDMERVEVLRGPQSTLFGKNSIAGALDLITAKPTDELTGYLTLKHETELDALEATSVVSGPLSDNLRGRIALRKLDDNGYVKNTFKNTDEPEQDIFSGRLSLEWDASDDITATYIGERSTFDTLGRPIEITLDEPNPDDPNELTYAQILTQLQFPAHQPGQNFERQTDGPEFSRNTSTGHTLRFDWDVNGYTFTSLTGSVAYDYKEACDCDFTPVENLNLDLAEEYSQLSQEFRVTSPQGGKVEWLGGLFLQTYNQDFTDTLKITPNSLIAAGVANETAKAIGQLFLEGVASQVAMAQGIPLADALALPEVIAQAQALAAEPASAGAAAVFSDFSNSGVKRDFSQRSNTQALFGQVTWHISDSFRMILGGRYTTESKTGNKVLHTIDLATGENQAVNPALTAQGLPRAAAIYASDSFRVGTVGSQGIVDRLDDGSTRTSPGHDVSNTRDESAFTPLAIAQWDINDNNSTYFSFTKGHKAGGFDPRSNDPDFFEFEEEKATAYELGYKTTTWDNRKSLNVALFYTDYEDLQISQFDGRVGFNVGNAKETRVQGLELDGRIAISSELMASYGLSLLDFEYIDFENGNCYQGQTPAAGTSTCDYSGQSGVYTPDYTLNFSLDYRRDLDKNLELVTVLDGQFVDGHQVHVNLDPQGEIDAYTLLGLRVQLGGEHWHVAALGKNLLDEAIITYSANAPLSGTTFGTNTYYSFIGKPRTLALEAAFKF